MQQVETISKDGLFRGYQALTVLTAVLLIVQPILIGQYFNDPDYLDLHGIVANVIFLSVVAQTVVCFLGRSRWGFGTVIANLVLAFLTTAQIGLGYSADGPSDVEVHLPVGVLMFGLGLVIAMLAFFDLKRQR